MLASQSFSYNTPIVFKAMTIPYKTVPRYATTATQHKFPLFKAKMEVSLSNEHNCQPTYTN
jgi:hypothetical protein